jgi:hypothetical protein
LTSAQKKDLIKYIHEKQKEADKIDSLASDHQMSMQRHESGKDYENTYSKFKEAI